jgi:hypothetical protein
MGYIIKDTAALITTKLTDLGRKKMSEGMFNISYFQVGDSEVCYDCFDDTDFNGYYVLMPEDNAQNGTPIPQKNKMNIKYPLFVDSTSGSTYGIPVKESYVDNIFNSAAPRGLFTGTTGYSSTFSAQTSSGYTVNPNFTVDVSTLNGSTGFTISASVIDATNTGQTSVGDFLTIYFGTDVQPISGSSVVLTYKVIEINGNTSGNTGSFTVGVDRETPDYSNLTGNARCMFYPSGMTELYDTYTPSYYWNQDAFDFESNCDVAESDVKVWNMNSPWTESPAGLNESTHQDYNYFGSTGYTGTKEYLGYNSDDGQTDTDGTFYYNSFSERINLSPSNQKGISIIHYTNQSIDNFYGEKFATESYDSTNPFATGQAANFKLSIPWLMWHKNSNATIGEEFYLDPTGFTSQNLLQVNYLQSSRNIDMNSPGIRYFHLWDTHENTNGYPNRVGKVWPDLKLITIDDDELVAALNGKSNRNWTLPAPKLGLITPNTFNGLGSTNDGVLSADTETMWITYRFNFSSFTESLHCNYYSKINGPTSGCTDTTQDITIRFGNEFPFLSDSETLTGFTADEFMILAQKTTSSGTPDPTLWRVIDMESQYSASTVGGYILPSTMSGNTFQLTKSLYDNASGSLYDLSDYITLPTLNQTGVTYNFGDDFYFNGNVKTDIQASIYVMNYKCNLGQTQFLDSSNPTWNGNAPYITEIGLYDSDKNLMIISKVQSPEKRQGVQQYPIKLDF